MWHNTQSTQADIKERDPVLKEGHTVGTSFTLLSE
jgi:hypothetical protein